MPNDLHRITIDAQRDRVHELIATKTGLKRSWTGHPVGGDESVGRHAALLLRLRGPERGHAAHRGHR